MIFSFGYHFLEIYPYLLYVHLVDFKCWHILCFIYPYANPVIVRVNMEEANVEHVTVLWQQNDLPDCFPQVTRIPGSS